MIFSFDKNSFIGFGYPIEYEIEKTEIFQTKDENNFELIEILD